MVRRRTAVSFAAAGMLLASPLLTACGSGPSHAGAAAVVGGKRITVSTLQAQVKNLRTAAAGSPQAAQNLDAQGSLDASVLNGLVIDRILDSTLAEEGITVSAGDVKQQRQAALQQQFGGNEKALESYLLTNFHVAPKDIDQFIRRNAAFGAIIQHAGFQPGSDGGNAALEQAVIKTAKRIGVSVNPRYGSWNADRATIGATSDPWILKKPASGVPSAA